LKPDANLVNLEACVAAAVDNTRELQRLESVSQAASCSCQKNQARDRDREIMPELFSPDS
jgi:hypothetical protein